MDSSPIDNVANSRDDLNAVIMSVFSTANLQLAIMLGFFFVLITSHVFINRVLVNFSGAVTGTEPTLRGRCILVLFQIIAFVLLDILIKHDVI